METSKNKALRAISDYLIDKGWTSIEISTASNAMQWVDPKTGQSHRTDFAFMVQTERDIYE